MKKPKLGSGQRFQQLKSKLGAKGAKHPAALAAYIGRKKYGNKKFAQLSAHGKKHRALKEGSKAEEAMDKKMGVKRYRRPLPQNSTYEEAHPNATYGNPRPQMTPIMKLKTAMRKFRV